MLLSVLELLLSGLNQLIVFSLGAAIGSFLNVVIYRVPAGLSLLYPPSRCPHCHHRLGKSENVPILGWLWLRGKCRHCRAAIAIRYPLVELVTALLFLAIFWHFSWSLITVGYWFLFALLLALALIDLDTMTLPNSMTRLGVVTGFSFQILLALVPAAWVVADPATITANAELSGIKVLANHLWTTILGTTIGLWLFDGIAIVGAIVFGKPAMGAGDAKLAALIGAWLGWQNLVLTGFLAALLGSFMGGGAIALKWLDRGQPIPFGPFLVMGAMGSALYGEQLVNLYLQLFFPELG